MGDCFSSSFRGEASPVIMKFALVLTVSLVCLTLAEGHIFRKKKEKKDRKDRRKNDDYHTRCHTVHEQQYQDSCHIETSQNCHTEYKVEVSTHYAEECVDRVTQQCEHAQVHHSSHYKREAEPGYHAPACHEVVHTKCHKVPKHHETKVPHQVCHPSHHQVCTPHAVSVPRRVCRRYRY